MRLALLTALLAATTVFGQKPGPAPSHPQTPPKKDSSNPSNIKALPHHRIEAHLLITTENLMPPEALQNEIIWMPELLKAVPELAVEMELLDPREVRYFFQRAEDFPGEMRQINIRYRLYKDAPKVADSERFPPRDAVNQMVKFNRAYHKNLEQYKLCNPDRAPLAQQVIRENDACYRFWDAVRDCRCEFYYITVRRTALQKMKDFLGDEDYLTLDNLPPSVPTWRFNELR